MWRLITVAIICGILPAQAYAAGMFLAPRGVRPLARAGAFVAGADDLNALSYNPAGLSEAVPNVLVDAALPMHTTEYTRSVTGDAQNDSFSPVVGNGMGVPSPTLGAVHDFGWVPGLVFAAGLAADYPLMQNWPDAASDPLAPQRYAAGSFAGTAMSKINAGVGYRLTDTVSVGAALHLLVGNFMATSTISTCDGAICTQPENPAYDATIQMQASRIAVPGASVGVQLRATEWVRFGLAWETGYAIDSPATLRVRLPSAALYNDAALSPETPQGRISMRLPQQWRLGVEVRPSPFMRVELAGVAEPWSVHDRVDLKVSNAAITNLLGLDRYDLSNITLPQGFRNTWSARLGGEYALPLGDERPMTLRVGLMYEPSAIPDPMLTAMAVDLDKLLASVGFSYQWDIWHVEVTYAHVMMNARQITNSEVKQTNPTRPAWDGLTAIGNGTYESRADLFGAGVRVDI